MRGAPSLYLHEPMSKTKHFRPTTPGQRFKVAVSHERRSPSVRGEFFSAGVQASRLPEALKGSTQRSSGRNNQGRVTVRSRGGGMKHADRRVSGPQMRVHWGEATVVGIFPDSRRSAPRVLMVPSLGGVPLYEDMEAASFRMPAPEGAALYDTYLSGVDNEVSVERGNVFRLRDLPLGTYVSAVSRKPDGPARFLRGAGAGGRLLYVLAGKAVLRMKSKKVMVVPEDCTGMVGFVGGVGHSLRRMGKAGVNRGLGRRPHVRGVAMNPVDHPHGGGEGKTSGGRPSVTPWGRLAKGVKTAKKHAWRRI